MGSLLTALAGLQIWFFVAFAVLVLLVIAVVVLVVLRGRKKAEEEKKAAAEPVDAAPAKDEKILSAREIRASFRKGFATYQDFVAGSRNPYLAPWLFMVGPAGSGKSALLEAMDPARPAEVSFDAQTGKAGGCSWRYFDKAVVLDVGGETILRADGSPAAEAGWGAILAECLRVRGRRPIDGVILALSAEELFGPNRLSLQQLTERAHALYAKLWQAQKALGLCLPVYVVVTKCDALPGFKAFAARLPEEARRGMLGWSSPYPLEASFKPEWCDEAFGALRSSLLQAELELFADAGPGRDAEELFFFQQRFADLREPLKNLLSVVFRRTAFQEALFFRGIYFTGFAPPPPASPYAPLADLVRPADPDAPTDGRADGDVGDRRPIFVRELFERMIFADRDLVKDTPQWSRAFARSQLYWRIGAGATAAVAALLLWVGATRLGEMRSGFMPVLKAIPDQMRAYSQAKDLRGAAGSAVIANGASGDKPAQELIRLYSRAPEGWSQPPLPAAWMSSVQERIAVAMSVGYHKILVGAARDALDQRGRAFGDPDKEVEIGNRPGLPELTRMRAFVGEAVVFERFAGVFNRLAGSGEVDGYPELMRYALKMEIPKEFLDRAAAIGFFIAPEQDLLNGASLDHEVRPIDLAEYRTAATARFQDLADAYFRRVLASNETMARLRQAASDIETASVQGRRAAQTSILMFEAVREALDDVQRQLSGQDANWVGAASMTYGPAMRDFLALVGDARLLGPQARDRVAQRGKEMMTRTGVDLRPVESLIGPLLKTDPVTNRADLSPEAQDLRRLLATWFGKSFMRADSVGRPPQPARGGLHLWDAAALEAAATMAEEYLLFDSREAAQMPKPMQSAVRAAAQYKLQTNLLAQLAKAQVPLSGDGGSSRSSGEADLRRVTRSLAAAYPLLIEISQTLRQLGLTEAQATLQESVVNQTMLALARVDDLLLGDRPYLPADRDLLSWTEGKLQPHVIFGLRSAAALQDYLAETRERVATLGRDLAEPLVAFLNRPEIRAAASNSGPAQRWTKILAELDRFEGGRPNTSLAGLERFIGQDLATVEPVGCAASIHKSAAEAGFGDFFSERMRELRDRLIAHCNQLIDARLAEDWRRVAGAFQNTLAGRYPFADVGEAFGPNQAAPDHVLDFYRQHFDPVQEGLLKGLEGRAGLGQPGRDAIAFLQQLKAGRKFLGPAIGLDDEPEPSVGLDPRFRVLTELEQGADKVIDWKLTVGDVSTDNFTRKPLTWRPRDPITVTLRWAKDGGVAPAGPSGGVTAFPNAGVDGFTLTYRYQGTWALPALLQKHLPASKDWRPTTQRPPHVLAFAVETQSAPRNATLKADQPDVQPSLGATAKLFMDLAVRPPAPAPGPDGKVPPQRVDRLVLPSLPRNAPVLFNDLPVFRSGGELPPGMIRASGFPGLAGSQ